MFDDIMKEKKKEKDVLEEEWVIDPSTFKPILREKKIPKIKSNVESNLTVTELMEIMFDDIMKEENEYKKYEKLEIPIFNKKYPKISFTVEKTKIEPRLRKLKDGKIVDFDEEIEMDWGKVGDNPFADARYAMAEYFNMDEDLRFAYQCNIAMFLNDKCGITDHEERNQLAKDLMNLIWG